MKTPKGNRRVTAAILEIVDNQLRDNVPPETRQTFPASWTKAIPPAKPSA